MAGALLSRKWQGFPQSQTRSGTPFCRFGLKAKCYLSRVGNRRVLAHALRVLLPKCEIECPLRLFRGAGSDERRRRIYGFSWTTHLDVARGFAERWQPVERDGVVFSEDGGVVLETTAPADAVLLVREDPDYYDESEVVVDPFHLGRVSLLERLTTPQFRPPEASLRRARAARISCTISSRRR